MNVKYFPHFIRANYPSYEISECSDKHLIEIGEHFKQYLQILFTNEMDKLEPIWNIDLIHVIENQNKGDILTVNGYHPALLIHFEKYAHEVSKY